MARKISPEVGMPVLWIDDSIKGLVLLRLQDCSPDNSGRLLGISIQCYFEYSARFVKGAEVRIVVDWIYQTATIKLFLLQYVGCSLVILGGEELVFSFHFYGLDFLQAVDINA